MILCVLLLYNLLHLCTDLDGHQRLSRIHRHSDLDTYKNTHDLELILSVKMFASLFLLTTLLSTCLAQNAECPSGNTYPVKQGETAIVISQAKKVSTTALLNLNSLRLDGTDLGSKTSTICLPYSCDIYTVRSGEICASIAQDHGLSLFAFKQYNLDLNGECQNLLADYNVCISEPKAAPGGNMGGKTRRRRST